MKLITKTIIYILIGTILIRCNSKEEKKEKFKYETQNSETRQQTSAKTRASGAEAIPVDFSNKGIGPVKSVTLAPEINQALATKGEELFKSFCALCHKPTEKFIGPPPIGIFERRSPEWIMNMIINPEVMVKEDPIAKQLLKEANGAPMTSQNITEEQARAILEYFRTLK